ncbi:MAG: Dam family site-specific DNA-(adenine-N6)-methyltransferase [Holosporaceae bacterium]|nr:Dam family site-specific DNA-(adenine-N6)-methyltransferase [Holosporaceae bacterium]
MKANIKQIESTNQPKPFVKWIGGKRSIINELLQRLPKQINNYYEPFVGGGALFFEIYNTVNHSYLSDLNVDLIVTYNTIKSEPKKLIELLSKHKKNHDEEGYYYKIRAMQNLKDPVENSARFIYLMKTCFNGLYRVNKNNEFNTPIGSYKDPNICDKKNILAVTQALKYATIKYQDFTKITPQRGDFVYFDPPYHPTSEDSFTKYLSTGFSEKDQTRLRDFALELIKSGVNVMISNSDAEFIIDIYKKNFNINRVSAPRVVNCKSDKRQSVYEILIRNF